MRGSCTYTSLHHVPHGERHRSVCHYDGGRRNEWMNEWRAEGREGGEVCRCGEGSENLYLLDFVCSRADVVKFVYLMRSTESGVAQKNKQIEPIFAVNNNKKRDKVLPRWLCLNDQKKRPSCVPSYFRHVMVVWYFWRNMRTPDGIQFKRKFAPAGKKK